MLSRAKWFLLTSHNSNEYIYAQYILVRDVKMRPTLINVMSKVNIIFEAFNRGEMSEVIREAPSVEDENEATKENANALDV